LVTTSVDQDDLSKVEFEQETPVEKKTQERKAEGADIQNDASGQDLEKLESDKGDGARKIFNLTSVLLKGETVEVFFSEQLSAISQKKPNNKRYNVKAQTEKVLGPSILTLIGKNSLVQEELYRNSDQIKRLSSLYGRFSPEISKNIVTEDLLR